MDHDTPHDMSGPSKLPPDELSDEEVGGLDSGHSADDGDEPPRVDYLKNMLPVRQIKPLPKRKWPLIVLLAALLLALLGGGGYWYWHTKQHHPTKPSAPTKQAVVSPAPVQSSPASTQQYVSNGNDLKLQFNYPSNWTISPPSGNNSNDQTITATSPLSTMTAADGSSVTGKAVLSIRPGTATLNELNGSTTVAQASVQFAYAKPTSAQHQYSYLTFIHVPAAGSTASSFNEVLLTGTLQFAQGTNLTTADVQVDPIISASFYSCTTQLCTGSAAKPLAISNATWQSTPVFQETLAVFESMQLN